MHTSLKRRRESGFSLLVISAGATALLGMLGLAVDMGRMFIVKTELQTFVDTAATSACQHLDGTAEGVTLAHSVATAGPLGSSKPNGWNFDTIAITGVTETYSTSLNGTYDDYTTAQAGATNTYRFMRVNVSVSAPLYFLAVIPGIGTTQDVAASAIAGEKEQDLVNNGGLVPFSPDAHNAADTKNFGLTPGQQYTLKWGNGNTTTCAGDAGFNPGNVPDKHGFVDLGQGNGNNNLRKAIVFGGWPNALSIPSSVDSGDVINDVSGNRGTSIFDALAERSNQDPDQTSLTWAQYQNAQATNATYRGNNRRIVTAAINDPSLAAGHGANGTVTVIGFGNFLLDPGATISGSSGPICATYIGLASLGGDGSGGTDGTKFYSVALFK